MLCMYDIEGCYGMEGYPLRSLLSSNGWMDVGCTELSTYQATHYPVALLATVRRVGRRDLHHSMYPLMVSCTGCTETHT